MAVKTNNTHSGSFANSACFNTILYFNKPAVVLHLKRESGEKSVHKVLQILHILCFIDVNSETETHFFLVKFLNSTSE